MKKSRKQIFAGYENAQQNYQLCQDALEHTISTIKDSSNQLSKEEKESESGMDIIQRINQMRAEPLPEQEYSLEWIKKIAFLSKKYGVGNCCEKSCFAFNYFHNLELKLIDYEIAIELFNDPFKDHFFVVLGRNPVTDPSDPRSWNQDTLICDPWGEGRSYFIGEVDFENIHDNPWLVMDSLFHPQEGKSPIQLKKDVLAKANDIKDAVVYQQDKLVLRARLLCKHGPKEFYSFNQNVPMVYESWDMPHKKDYKRQQQMDARSSKTPNPNCFFNTEVNSIKKTNASIPIGHEEAGFLAT